MKLNQIKIKLSNLGRNHFDKVLHFIGGQLIYFLLHSIIGINALYAIIAVLIIATVVEIYDWYTGTGTLEIMDIVATVAGAVFLYFA